MNTAAVFATLSRAGIEPFPWCPVASELSPKQTHRLLLQLVTTPYADGYLAISDDADTAELVPALTQLGVPGASALARRLVGGALRADEEADHLAAQMERVRTRAEDLYRSARPRYTYVQELHDVDPDDYVYRLLEVSNETLDQTNLRESTPRCVGTLAALEVALHAKLGWRRLLPAPAILALLGSIALVDAVASLWTGRLDYGLIVGAVSLVLLTLAVSQKRRASRTKASRASVRQDSTFLALPDAGPVAELGRGNKAS